MTPRRIWLVLFASLLPIVTIQFTQAQQTSKDPLSNDPSQEAQYVTVVGAVHFPSRFELSRPVHLKEAIQLAGGVTEEGSSVRILHYNISFDDYNLAAVLRGDENSNPRLQPGDIVSVSGVDKVYVIGNVFLPKPVLFKESLTVSQAIVLAGGALRDTKMNKIKVYRLGTGNARTEFTVDLKAIKDGRAEDLLLQPNDIVNVPDKRGIHGLTIRSYQVVPLKKLPLRVIE